MSTILGEVQLWGYPELQYYLKKLIINERDTVRNGFPPVVANEIAGIFVAQNDDLWSQCHLK